MSNFFKLASAGPLFFVSAWLLMLFAGILRHDLGIRPFGYVTSLIADHRALAGYCSSDQRDRQRHHGGQEELTRTSRRSSSSATERTYEPTASERRRPITIC